MRASSGFNIQTYSQRDELSDSTLEELFTIYKRKKLDNFFCEDFQFINHVDVFFLFTMGWMCTRQLSQNTLRSIFQNVVKMLMIFPKFSHVIHSQSGLIP